MLLESLDLVFKLLSSSAFGSTTMLVVGSTGFFIAIAASSKVRPCSCNSCSFCKTSSTVGGLLGVDAFLGVGWTWSGAAYASAAAEDLPLLLLFLSAFPFLRFFARPVRSTAGISLIVIKRESHSRHLAKSDFDSGPKSQIQAFPAADILHQALFGQHK